MRKREGQAIVVGGSIAGLLAARVLSDFFERVTILERDHVSNNMETRPGTPQGRHLHALLPRGRRILENLFPGITSELVRGGAEILDVANDISWLTPQGWGVRFQSEFEGVTSTRSLIEAAVRKQISLLSNVEILQECAVVGLVGDAAAVKGVEFVRCEAGELRSEINTLQADFVVVANGRFSLVWDWLQEIGVRAAETTVLNAHIGYASRLFRRPEPIENGWRAIFLQAAPPAFKRAGILFPVEGNRWLVTLQGGDRDYPPTTDRGFLQFAESLRSPILFEAIRGAEPLSPISSYRATQNCVRHYQRLSKWPERLVVLGDALCAFNPVYGQGMTTAALAAELLADCFERSGNVRDRVARKFQKRVAKVNQAPWMLATGEDLRYPNVEGASAKLAGRLVHRYIDKILRASTHSVVARKKFLSVQGMLAAPAALFSGTTIGIVLREYFRRTVVASNEGVVRAASSFHEVARIGNK